MQSSKNKNSSNNNKGSLYKERFSKKGLKILIGQDDCIKKPAPLPQDNMNTFIGSAPIYPKEIRNLQSSTPNKSKELPVPFVFSQGHTPEMKQIGIAQNVFNFETAKSPASFAPFGYSPNRRPGNGFSVYDSHSPFRPAEFVFTNNPAHSPAFVFENSNNNNVFSFANN